MAVGLARRTAAFVMLLSFSSMTAQSVYFPTGTFHKKPSYDKFVNDWYSIELKALQEPSLYSISKSGPTVSYRFLWLRTFNQAVAIRLDIQPDGSALLTTKMGTGESGFALGKLKLESSSVRSISAVRTKAFLEHVDRASFWAMPTMTDGPAGSDGSEWVIEGTRNGEWHIVTRWTPSQGSVRDLGMELAFDLAGLQMPKKDIY